MLKPRTRTRREKDDGRLHMSHAAFPHCSPAGPMCMVAPLLDQIPCMARDVVDLTPMELRDDSSAGSKRASSRSRSSASAPSTRSSLSRRAAACRCPTRANARFARCSSACSICSAGSRSWTGQHHRPCRRDRRRCDLARAGRPVRAVRRAGRDHPPPSARVDGASRAAARGRAPARHRLPRARHEPEMDAGRDAGHAEEPLQDHDRLHAEGRHARPRHDVPHLHREANFDFASEADMVKKLRVSIALQPVSTALFANSPFTEGKPSGFFRTRRIWRGTDNARAGMLPFVFDRICFERYVDYALKVPMYFVKRGRISSTFRHVFRACSPKTAGTPRLVPPVGLGDHLSTIFPEVRLKRFSKCAARDRRTVAAPAGASRLPEQPTLWRFLARCRVGYWSRTGAQTERQKLRDDVPAARLQRGDPRARDARISRGRCTAGSPRQA